MKLRVETANFSRYRWPIWLRQALRSSDLTESSFPKKFADQAACREEQRTLSRRWLDGKVAISPDSAYIAGETLATNGHPYASGLAAVLAAGHLAPFARTMRALGVTLPGFFLAVEILPSVSLAVEGDIAESNGWLREPEKTHVEIARRRLAIFRCTAASKQVKMAWEERDYKKRRYDDESLRKAAWLSTLAVQIAESPDAPAYLAWRESARFLDIWIRHSGNVLRNPNSSHQTQEAGDEYLQSLIAQSERRYDSYAARDRAEIPDRIRIKNLRGADL